MTLRDFQRRMASVIMAPLTRSDRIATRAEDGKSMKLFSAELVRANLRLRAADRLEIYARSYWYRVIDSLHEDFPGLRFVLGTKQFTTLIRAYLTDCPSNSFSLRNLGSRLVFWLRRNPSYAADRLSIALDMVRLEWAHIEAWDAKTEKLLAPEDLIEVGPALRIGLQPYVRLLHLHYPADHVRLQANVNGDREELSGTLAKRSGRRPLRTIAAVTRQNVFLAVHRLNFNVYYKRLAQDEYQMLRALRDGRTIREVLAAGLGSTRTCRATRENYGSRVESLFALWAELGWLCQPTPKKARESSRT